METDKHAPFDVFCLECNIQVEARVIATVGHGFESEALNPDDQVDAPFKQNIFSIAVCPKCDAPFFIKEELRGVPGEFEAIADETVLYPAAVHASFENSIRLPKAVCVVVAEVLQPGSHAIGESLFLTAGAPGPPPDLPHTAKWKDWLFRAGNDPNVDSLSVLGNVLEEFMDIGPREDSRDFAEWKINRERVVQVLEENGFRYYRGGRVLPTGQTPEEVQPLPVISGQRDPTKPAKIDELLEILLKGLRRTMHPLTYRRKGAQALSFSAEYDVQDLLHALLRPWVTDIRPEEFAPSYAGTSTRMDFLLPKHGIVLELKFVRDRNHAKKIGDELVEKAPLRISGIRTR
jgi:hypothetical protein